LPRWFSLFDTLAITPTLPIAFFFTRRGRPVTLLGLPPRPLPRRLPALFAAIALARFHRTKPLVATFQQTAARPWPAGQAFPPAVFLILGRACRILDRAHGSVAPGKLIPRRGLASSPGRSRSGSARTQDSIADEPGATSRSVFFPPPAVRLVCEFRSPASPLWDPPVQYIAESASHYRSKPTTPPLCRFETSSPF
jgi:hypothetical protein